MMVSVSRFIYLGWIEDHFVDPIFHFKYYGFFWVKSLGLYGMYAIHFMMFLSAAAVTVGYRYRLSIILLFLTFTYTELIDLTYYLNHYYFVSLVLFLMVFLPMHRAVSLDVRSGRVQFVNRIPAWMVHSLMVIISIVYVYAGLAKINQAWLFEALPLSIWLPAHDDLPIIGPVFRLPIVHYIFAWTGMFYDTFIIFFLLWGKARKWAFASVVIFHVLTGLLFQIGVFPIVMICVVTIFFSAEWHHAVLVKLCRIIDKWHLLMLNNINELVLETPKQKKQLFKIFLTSFFAFQLLFPLRHFLYPGNIFWTEQGYRFSWRVMLMEKSGVATFYVKDGDSGREGQVFNNEFLNAHQEKQMAMQPDMILQYAHFLGEYYQNRGMAKPIVRVESYITLNGSPSKLLLDTELDLMMIEDGFRDKDWLTEY